MAYADVLELNRRQPRRDDAAPATPQQQLSVTTPMTGAAGFLAYLGAAREKFRALAGTPEPD